MSIEAHPAAGPRGWVARVAGADEAPRRGRARGGDGQLEAVSSARILLVGDHADRVARAAIEDAGHRVETALDGAAALAALEREPADLILAEWPGSGGDGAALCRSVRGRRDLAATHVVALVTGERAEGATDALEAGADDYLGTPFERAELVARLRMGLRATQLRASESRLWALIANVPGAIYRCANDADWTMDLISAEIERISGYPPTDFMQNACRTFASVIHPDDRDDVARSVAHAIEEERPFALEYRIVRADGQVAWVLERGQLVHANDGRVWLDGAIFDITERRRAEEALREGEAERARLDEVRASRARIVEAADAARRRLERDLHDGAQQQLVALALKMRLARGQAEADPEATAQLLDEALADAERAREDLRELARGLHPAVLTDRGLDPALQLLADRAPLPVELSVDLATPLPGPVELAAYFVVAEALTNAAKYAAAERARVTVSRREGGAFVEVADDGVGGAEASAGSGLRGLADRVGALDGRLEIESPSGRGTRVRAMIPCA